MSEEEAEIIVFPIRFEVDAQNIEDVTKEAEQITEGEAAEEEGVVVPEFGQEEGMEELLNFIKTTDKKGLQTLSSFAKNPTSLVQGELLGLLGKAGVPGAIAVAIIGIIIGSPEIIRTIVKALSVKGGPLNQDFHRFFEDEAQFGLARELQYRRAVGLDVVITSDNEGFLLQDPGFVGNSLVDADTTRALRLSSNEEQYGYVNGM